jgi:hypothetical protein|tara:strand:+ start:782 stop:952 length:171 start_codon:yes stop_codon:yes gene_type:complete
MKYKVIEYSNSIALEAGLNAMCAIGWTVTKITEKTEFFVVIYSRTTRELMLEEGQD